MVDFFRILLTDQASREDRLRAVTERIERELEKAAGFGQFGLYLYFNYRSQSGAEDLRKVASAFDQLYELRQSADSENAGEWLRTSALNAVGLASDAFAAWRRIRTEEDAQGYLLQLLVQRR
ncbi:MAG TPA: hypothetical protein VMT86_04235 [Bryobacteraceae bacterium]|nr:hypothetical protein [Bryobacteraceae bacterium]